MSGRIGYFGNVVQSGLLFSIDSTKDDSNPRVGTKIYTQQNRLLSGDLINGVSLLNNKPYRLSFDGINDYIDISNLKDYMFECTSFKALNSIVGAQTINIWFKVKIDSPDSGCLLSFTDRSVGNYCAIFYGTATSTYNDESIGVVILDGITGLNLTAWVRRGNTYLFDDKWHNFTYTTDASGNKLYLDGVSENIGYQTGNLSRNSVFNAHNPSKTNVAFLIGARNIGSIDNYSKTEFGYLSVYNRALTTNEVQLNYNLLRRKFEI